MTKQQARKLALQIRERFGEEIAEDAARSYVPESLIAGFIGSEAGKDRQGNIVPEAVRFEPHVFAALKSIRDTGRRGARSDYNGIRQSHLAGASDAALKALATSYNVTQIMGWWVLVGKIRGWWPTDRLDGTINQLRSDEYHLEYAVILFEQSAGRYIRSGNFEAVCRIWNTGSPTGKTYHENYVANILDVKAAYEDLAREFGPVAAESATETTEAKAVDVLGEDASALIDAPVIDTEIQAASFAASTPEGDRDERGENVAAQPVGTQPAAAAEPVVKSPSVDVATVASSGTTAIGKAIAAGSLPTAGLLTWLQANWIVIAILIVCGTAIFLFIYILKHKEKIKEAELRADPSKLNVTFERKKK